MLFQGIGDGLEHEGKISDGYAFALLKVFFGGVAAGHETGYVHLDEAPDVRNLRCAFDHVVGYAAADG